MGADPRDRLDAGLAEPLANPKTHVDPPQRIFPIPLRAGGQVRDWIVTGVLLSVPLLATVLSLDSMVGKDEIWHFSYLHSIMFDRDLDLANEYETIYSTWERRPWFVEETGRPPNQVLSRVFRTFRSVKPRSEYLRRWSLSPRCL